jgi:hypothetical protein
MDCDPRDDYDSREDERFGPNGQARQRPGDRLAQQSDDNMQVG